MRWRRSHETSPGRVKGADGSLSPGGTAPLAPRGSIERLGHPSDPQAAAAPLPVPAGRPGARARDQPSHQGVEERVDQRAVLRWPLSAPPGDAGRADARGAGTGGRAAGVRVGRCIGRARRDRLLRRHRRRALQASGRAGRPVDPRRDHRPREGRHLEVQHARQRERRDRGRGQPDVHDAAQDRRDMPWTQVHPTAIVDPQGRARHVGERRALRDHRARTCASARASSIGAHTVVEGHTTIGSDNRIFQLASVGAQPQDKKYGGEPTRLEIGNGNTIREFVTINTGTVQDVGVTRLGDDNWIMAYVHIAHDCQLGSHSDPGQRRAARRPRAAGRLGLPRRLVGRAPVRARRRARDDRVPDAAGARRAAVRHGGRQPGSGTRHQPGRAAPPRLHARAHRARSSRCTSCCTARA